MEENNHISSHAISDNEIPQDLITDDKFQYGSWSTRDKEQLTQRTAIEKKSGNGKLSNAQQEDIASILNLEDAYVAESLKTKLKAVPIHELILGERRPSTEEPLPPGTSITRRKRWLEKYLVDLENGQLDKRLEQQHGKMQAKRRKRSLPSGVEGQSFTNVSCY